MPIYSVKNKTTGESVYKYDSPQPVEWVGFEFANFDHVEETAPILPVIDPVITGSILTKLEFLRRFTVDERVAIRTAAKSNPVLEDYMEMVDLAQDIDTSDQDTRNGVMMLEQVGLLAPGRALEILNGN